MRFLAFVAALALAACTSVMPPPQTSSVTSDVMLEAERLSATTVQLRLRNSSTQRVGYNLCVSALERRGSAEWTAVRTNEVCTMELRILEPGGTATFEKTLPAGLAAGDYRYLTEVEYPLGSQQIGIASDPFRID